MRWEQVYTTSEKQQEELITEDNKVKAEGRSVALYISKKDERYSGKPGKEKRKTAKKNESMETL